MESEMRLIDANEAIEKLKDIIQNRKEAGLQYQVLKVAYIAVADCSTVDAVEVVRCKDCKHFVQNEPYDPCECMKWTVKWGVAYVNPDDFCSYGKRKSENEADL